MLFYQVHFVAWFFSTFQNTLLHQTEHGKLPRTNTQLGVSCLSLLLLTAEIFIISRASLWHNNTLCVFTDRKIITMQWEQTGFGWDIITVQKRFLKYFKSILKKALTAHVFCLHCQEFWQYSSCVLQLLKMKCYIITLKIGNVLNIKQSLKTKLSFHTSASFCSGWVMFC